MKKLFTLGAIEVIINILVGAIITSIFNNISLTEGGFIVFAFTGFTGLVTLLSYKVNKGYKKQSTYYIGTTTEAIIINILWCAFTAYFLFGETTYVEAIKNLISDYRDIAYGIALITIIKIFAFELSFAKKHSLTQA